GGRRRQGAGARRAGWRSTRGETGWCGGRRRAYRPPTPERVRARRFGPARASSPAGLDPKPSLSSSEEGTRGWLDRIAEAAPVQPPRAAARLRRRAALPLLV